MALAENLPPTLLKSIVRVLSFMEIYSDPKREKG